MFSMDERVRKTGHLSIPASMGCTYREMDNSWAVEEMDILRDWRIQRSIVYGGVVPVSSQ